MNTGSSEDCAKCSHYFVDCNGDVLRDLGVFYFCANFRQA